jgi:uncharacterized protein YecT (DUF1311 family)
MQRIVTLAVVLFLALTLGAQAETQYQMNANSAKEFARADKELTELYKVLLDSLDKDGKAALISSQQAWVKYRDAESTFEAHPSKGGTIYAMVYTDAMNVHTRQRIEELKTFQKAMQEK